jgi:heme/copper-type cytochrome/quinol oxidase subunit 2
MDKVIIIVVMLVVFIVFGLFIYGIVRLTRRQNDELIRNSIKTEGVVVGVRFMLSMATPFWHLLYYYYDNNGKRHDGFKPLGVSNDYKKGQKITVYYHKDNPKRSLVLTIQKKGDV